MHAKVWIKHILHGAFLSGTVIAVALWIAAITAMCEGFGCLGVGAIAGMAFAVQLACLVMGGILIWLRQLEGNTPKWLILFEALHLVPVAWFSLRMLLS